MATTKIWKFKSRLDTLIEYAINGEKTEHKLYVSGINCMPDTAFYEMKNVKKQFFKTGGIECFHAIQSFVEKEVTPEQAHEIGIKLAEELWGDKYQVVVSTHLNTDNIHNHFVLNSVSFLDGKRFCNAKKDYATMRKTSDRLCEYYGLSVLKQEEKYNKYATSSLYKELMKDSIDYAIENAKDYNEFIKILQDLDYIVTDKNNTLSIRREPYKRNTRIEKQFGKGSVMKLGDRAAVDVAVIPTGSLTLDMALGIGGYPKGRIIEIYGPESSGKTTLTLHAIAEVQKQGGTAAFIDAEHAIDPVYAKNLGVNIDELILSQPDSGEQGLEIAETLVRSGAIDLVVVDSVAALVPQVELDGEMGDQQMGLQARLMSKALRKLSGVMNKTDCTIIFINQLREKIGVMFGNPETTTGGRALKFYSSVRVEIRRSEAIKNGTEIVGNKVNIKVVKNKVAPPFKSTSVDIIYGKGISRDGEVLDLAVEKDIVDKSGAWYAYKGEKIGQGRENAKRYLIEHPDIMNEITEAIKASLMPSEEEV